MKRMMKVAFIVLMAGTLVGCGNNGSSNMDNIIEDKYDEILSKITVSIENEEESESGELIPLTSQDSSEKQNGKAHSIEVIDAKEVIKKCPKSAKAGNKVTIKTNCFMDAIPKINVNGNDIGEWDGNRTEYTFIMPDEDIEITTTLKSASDF